MISLRLKKNIFDFYIDADICCQAGKSISIIGESGAGKTTLLRLIAGLETPDLGYIKNEEKYIFSSDKKINIPSRKRKFSYVFQEYTLFPHWTVEKNILYTADNRDFAYELMEDFRISHLAKRKPGNISGGERQRAALVQAIARKPALLLLDEPFSSLDPENRRVGRELLISMRDKIFCPVILVTHDHNEASYIGDVVYVMNKGRITRQIETGSHKLFHLHQIKKLA